MVAVRREDLRAADTDRGFVAERLKAALDEGRLSVPDYDERLRQAYQATTYGDLDHVLADLPQTVPDDEAQLVPAGSYYPPPATSLLHHLQTMSAWRLWFVGVWMLVVVFLVVGGVIALTGQ